MPPSRRRTNARGDVLEASFGTAVENLLDLYGWRWYHPPDNRPLTAKSGRRYVQSTRRGFPDYVALRGPELLVIELKAERGRLGPGQAEWLEDWRAFGEAVDGAAAGAEGRGYTLPMVDVYLWRPSDLETINDRLSRGRHRLELAG